MSNTSLGYCGNVEIRTKTKNTRCRNSGTRNLFRLLTSFLAGDKVETNNHLPAYIALYNRNSADVLSEPETNNNHDYRLLIDEYIPLIAQSFAPTDSDNLVERQYRTQFEAVVDYKCVVDVAATDITLALVSNNQEHILAAVDFPVDDYNVIRAGGLATIFWNLTFENISD